MLCPIIGFIPFGEAAQAFADGDGGAEAVVAFEGFAVGVGDGNVAGLHGDEPPMGFKVVIGRQDARADKLFLQGGDVIEQILRRAAADVVDRIGRQRKSVLAGCLFRRALHDAQNALDDVIDIGKVALAVAVIEDVDRLPRDELLRCRVIKHIRSAGRSVDREKPQPRGRDVVELRIAVCQQLVALFCCSVKGYRIVHLVVGAERNLFIAAVHRGGRGVDQMLHGVVTAGFEDVVEADQV